MNSSEKKNFFSKFFHSLLLFFGEGVVFWEERLAKRFVSLTMLTLGLLFLIFVLVYFVTTQEPYPEVKNSILDGKSKGGDLPTKTELGQSLLEQNDFEGLQKESQKLGIRDYYFFEQEINLEENSDLLLKPVPQLSPLNNTQAMKDVFVKKEIFHTEDITIEAEISRLVK